MGFSALFLLRICKSHPKSNAQIGNGKEGHRSSYIYIYIYKSEEEKRRERERKGEKPCL